jgi:hypothetical protein
MVELLTAAKGIYDLVKQFQHDSPMSDFQDVAKFGPANTGGGSASPSFQDADAMRSANPVEQGATAESQADASKSQDNPTQQGKGKPMAIPDRMSDKDMMALNERALADVMSQTQPMPGGLQRSPVFRARYSGR